MMSDNMITNYSRPALAMNVIVTGGVSYSSNLQQVQDILMEVATKIVVESEHAVTDTEPRAGFSNFGDSNIDFWVFLQGDGSRRLLPTQDATHQTDSSTIQ